MHALFTNVFFNKDKEFDDCINICFWILIITKNVLKWLFVFYVVENHQAILIGTLLITPCLKFLIIGIKSISHFKTKFRACVFITFIIVEILIECFFELPCHFFFPRNIIYFHTIYFRIYDKASFRNLELYSEIIENFILDIYLLDLFLYGKSGFSIIAMLLIIFCNLCLIYFCLAKGYFFFFDPPQEDDNKNKDFYGLTVNKDKPIPFEIVNVNDRNRIKKNSSAMKKENDRDNDSANNDLVNTKNNN